MKVLIITFPEIRKFKRIMDTEVLEEEQVSARLSIVSYTFLKCH